MSYVRSYCQTLLSDPIVRSYCQKILADTYVSWSACAPIWSLPYHECGHLELLGKVMLDDYSYIPSLLGAMEMLLCSFQNIVMCCKLFRLSPEPGFNPSDKAIVGYILSIALLDSIAGFN
jgi:hypothetical protein